jgi:MarR family transcriptional regulator, 2-MHQ and catechol-resistance regulon repressor
MNASLKRQAERMYAVFAELVRRYQFRDRDQVCCHGLSVSQCYTLQLLAEAGAGTMSRLAAEIYLDVSTATRVVDQLVARGLASRVNDPHDRRVCRVRITKAGQALLARVQAEIVAEYEAVLKNVPAGSRKAVIDALSRLLTAFKNRRGSAKDRCSGRKPVGKVRRQDEPRRKRKTRKT